MNGASPRALAALGALVLIVVARAGVAMEHEPPLPPPRPAESAPAPAEDAGSQPVRRMGPEAAGPACLAQLVASGARVEAATAPAPTGEGCGIASPIRLSSVTVAGGDVVSLPDRPIFECEFAAVLADYIQLIVAPLGEALLRAKVASIEPAPATTAGPRTGSWEQRSAPMPRGSRSTLLRSPSLTNGASSSSDRPAPTKPRTSARFGRRPAAGSRPFSVRAPTRFHANNMHMDIEKHGSSGSYRICE